jgi:hypothetical protein
MDGSNGMVEEYMKTMTGILMPVHGKKYAVLAAEYSKACGRDVYFQKIWNMR